MPEPCAGYISSFKILSKFHNFVHNLLILTVKHLEILRIFFLILNKIPIKIKYSLNFHNC
jgi:hypothetical protein